MLETIFEWLTHAVGEGLEAVINLVLGCLSLDLSTFVTEFPAFALAYDIFRYAGLGLVVVIAVVSLLKFQFGDLEDVREPPANILIRCFLAVGLVFAGGHAVLWIFNLAKIPYDILLDLDAVRVTFAPDASWEVELSVFTGGVTAEALLGLMTPLIPAALLLLRFLMLVIVCAEILKLLVEVFERFMMTGVLVYSAPLAFSAVASKETSVVFTQWLGMFVSQCILMTLSVWMLKLAASGFSATAHSYTPYAVRFLMTYALCRIGQRLDTYIRQLGLNSVSTGGGLLDSAVGALLAFTAFRPRGSSSGVLGDAAEKAAGAARTLGHMGVLGGAAGRAAKASPPPSGARKTAAPGTAGRTGTHGGGPEIRKENGAFTLGAEESADDGDLRIDAATGAVTGPRDRVSSLLRRHWESGRDPGPDIQEALRRTVNANPEAAADALADSGGRSMTVPGRAGSDALRCLSPSLERLTGASGGFENVRKICRDGPGGEGASTEIHADIRDREGRPRHVTWTDEAGYARRDEERRRGWAPDGSGGYFRSDAMRPGEYGALSADEFELMRDDPRADVSRMTPVRTREDNVIYVLEGYDDGTV